MHPLIRYIRKEALPTAFCPGCGNGIIMKAMFEAFDMKGIDRLDNVVFVSGIGCAAWIPSPHIDADSIHTLHGRAIPVATGVKLSNPQLEVIVISGDGDLIGIGGNHLIHAARRNMDLLVIMVNNMIYGMTGGQVSPTTPLDAKTTTTPYGNIEVPFDTCLLVDKLGANYVARWTVGHYLKLRDSIIRALDKRGFRFIEVISQCTARVCSRLGISAAEYIRMLMRKSVSIKRVKDPYNEIVKGNIVVGIYADRDNPSYIERMRKVVSC